jgi:predicted rRNA methylase YqxC with S4 and FtsJ domains
MLRHWQLQVDLEVDHAGILLRVLPELRPGRRFVSKSGVVMGQRSPAAVELLVAHDRSLIACQVRT